MSEPQPAPAPPVVVPVKDPVQPDPTPSPAPPVVPIKDPDTRRVYAKFACVVLNSFLSSLVAAVAAGTGPVVDAIKPWVVILGPLAITAATAYAFLDRGVANLLSPKGPVQP